jgi:hypothetical protein
LKARKSRAAAVAALGLALCLAAAQMAWAGAIKDEEELVQVGTPRGTGAGKIAFPWGVGSDPVTGHLYVVEDANNRVSEFTPWGEFVKAFGWDVAPGAVDEVQEVRVRAGEGQFRLKLGGGESGDLEVGTSGEELEAELEGQAAIGPSNVEVRERPGTTDGLTPFVYVVEFEGSLAGSNIAELEVVDGTTPLAGGVPSTSLETRTRVDGHAATTGLEACTTQSGCNLGLEGSGAGEFAGGRGVTVDPSGNVYVSERGNARVQKFDSAGRHILTFANSGVGQLGAGGGQGIALCPPGNPVCGSGVLFVADKERIVRFSLAGAFEASLPVPGHSVEGVAFDPVSEDLYVTFEGEEGLHKLDSGTGAEIEGPWPLPGSGPVATDAEGDVFVRSIGGGVLEYGPSGGVLEPPSCCEEEPFRPRGLGTTGAGDLAVSYDASVDSFVRVFGPIPVIFEGPPQLAPSIVSQFVTSVAPEGASVQAVINPHFWSDTHYRVQYGTGKCSEGGCTEEAPAGPEPLLTGHAVDKDLKSGEVFLEGLVPGTTYHYRFVALSSGGGPTIAEEGAFTTPEPLPRSSACPNDALRGGPGALLPDCRAYEMVSPLNKNNGDIKTLSTATSLFQSSLDGEVFTYSSYRSFAEPEGATIANQYLARRDPEEGWQSGALIPTLAPPPPSGVFNDLVNPFKVFSADLCQSWLVAATEPPLDPPHDFAGYRNIYRRDLCREEGDEALITTKPTVDAGHFVPEPQGASADGKKAIFRAQLEEGGPWQAYYSAGGQMTLVCVLPDGTAVGGNCSGGSSVDGTSPDLNILANVAGALSTDATKAYWTDSGAAVSGSGAVYLRINPGAPQGGGESCEENKACTVEVSGTVTGEPSHFLAATPGGQRALFVVNAEPGKGDLYQFTLGEGSTLIASKVVGVAGASTDLSRIYLISEEALDSGAEAGKPNLYLAEGGAFSLIATLSKEDVNGAVPDDSSPKPVFHAARATPAGGALAFISTEPLTGYDNTDLESGEADSEVYLYRASSGGPVCISCNPGGARPHGRVLRGAPAFTESPGFLPTAASLPMSTVQLHIPRALSEDGQRLFFNSYDTLLPRDTNGKEDVYEWESAVGESQCEELGADLYVASAEGCLSLISSGQSGQDSEFADASSSGDDVFFITNASLLPRDPGLYDAYDARVGGGIAEPEPPEICQGETCKPPPISPETQTPSSSAYEGPGDLEEKPKHKKKHKHKKHKHHKKKRKAGR